MTLSTLLTHILVLATLAGNILLACVVLAHVVARQSLRKAGEWMSSNVLLLGLLLSLGAMLGSLFYSEVLGYPACILCWTQRIFMYPLVFLFGLALWRKDRAVIPYALFLTLLGGATALYQWVKEMLALYGGVTIPCPAVSNLPSCDRIYVLEFGYITIAMIALNAFLLIAAVLSAGLKNYDPPS